MFTPPPSRWSTWHGTALVVGCGGIGQALLRHLGQAAPNLHRVGASRGDWRAAGSSDWQGVEHLPLELTDDTSLQGLGTSLQSRPPLRVVIYTAGVLHGPQLQPEKRLAQVNRLGLEQSFAINAFAPLLVAQAIEACLPVVGVERPESGHGGAARTSRRQCAGLHRPRPSPGSTAPAQR